MSVVVVSLIGFQMAFSERIIPILVQQNIEWVIVADNHISRACQNYQYSPSGDNNNPPNPADQIKYIIQTVLFFFSNSSDLVG